MQFWGMLEICWMKHGKNLFILQKIWRLNIRLLMSLILRGLLLSKEFCAREMLRDCWKVGAIVDIERTVTASTSFRKKH